jgi:chromosome segregation ATPase
MFRSGKAFSCLIILLVINPAAMCLAEETDLQAGMLQNPFPMITMDALSECAERTLEIDIIARQLKEQQAELEQIEKNMDDMLEQRNRAWRELNFYNPESVNDYNSLNKKLSQFSVQYAEQVEQYNKEVRNYQSETSKLKEQCHNKRYFIQ